MTQGLGTPSLGATCTALSLLNTRGMQGGQQWGAQVQMPCRTGPPGVAALLPLPATENEPLLSALAPPPSRLLAPEGPGRPGSAQLQHPRVEGGRALEPLTSQLPTQETQGKAAACQQGQSGPEVGNRALQGSCCPHEPQVPAEALRAHEKPSQSGARACSATLSEARLLPLKGGTGLSGVTTLRRHLDFL